MKINLKNKKVIIIGGSGTIGKQITNDFSYCGAKVLVLDTTNKFLNKKSNFF